MIEFSFTDIALLVWAGLATAAAFEYKLKEEIARMMIFKIVEDPFVYQHMHDSFIEQKKQFLQQKAKQ